MIVAGLIQQRGALAPEEVVPVEPFFRELHKRGMRIVINRRYGTVGANSVVVAGSR
jgi:hypothetical protein